MVNGENNYILIDGRMILHETLGSYTTVIPEEYYFDYNRTNLATLGNWSDTLGLIDDVSIHASSDSGYSEEIEEPSSTLTCILKELDSFSEELLKKLSAALLENYYIIPDDYKIEISVSEPEEIVFRNSDSNKSEEFLFKVKISIGKAKLNFSANSVESVKYRLTDILNGCILMARSGISFKE